MRLSIRELTILITHKWAQKTLVTIYGTTAFEIKHLILAIAFSFPYYAGKKGLCVSVKMTSHVELLQRK